MSIIYLQKQTDLYLERSPKMKTLARQEEIVNYEQSVQKMTTKVSLQSDPWEVNILDPECLCI